MGAWERMTRTATDIDREGAMRPMRHSGGYHKFFEGYTEYYVVDARGRRRLERVYTGPYYRQALSPWKRAALRLLYTALYLAAQALYLFGAVRQEGLWYLVLPIALTALSAALLLIALLYYLFAPVQMKLYLYKQSSVNLRRYAAACCIGLFLCAAAALAHMLCGAASAPLPVLSFALGGVCMLTVLLIERRAPYLRVKNAAQAPPGGFEIG